MDTEQIQIAPADSPFRIGINRQSGNLIRLQHATDPYATDFLFRQGLGAVELRLRTGDSGWQQANSADADDVREVTIDDPMQPRQVVVAYKRDSQATNGIRHVTMRQSFTVAGAVLEWQIHLSNRTAGPLEIGDLALPLLFHTDYARDAATTYQQRVIRHSYLAGHGSFIVVMRPNGIGPFLVITPVGETKLEYFHRQPGAASWEGIFTAYIHALASGTEETRGTWRQPHTSVILSPTGEAGDTVEYGFRLQWANDYTAVRDLLYQEGLLDIQVIPGMSVPQDLTAAIAIRTRHAITDLQAEFPGETTIEYLGEQAPDRHHYRLRFARLGENCLTVCYGNGRRHYLEFFVTEALETLLKKRAAFITRNQQIRDPSHWYDGLFSLWDMRERVLRHPDDPGGLYPYMVGGSDDPTLCKATYLAVKNLHFPIAEEIAAVEYYLRNFVWGKLQRTADEAPHPYGIYGVDNWYVNRHSAIGLHSGGNGQERMWRTFDYPHLILLYFAMYQVAVRYPDLVGYLDEAGYLERAFGTAQAFFVVPYNIRMDDPFYFHGWCDWAYKQGNFHERVIPDLISALAAAGQQAEATWLRGEWEKKVKYFVYDHPYPFGSEMFFDTTAFESTHSIARYGLENRLEPDEQLWQDKNSGVWYSHPAIQQEDFSTFMEKALAANIAGRGWLETSFYQLGSDIRQHGNSNYLLSYMTQLGGWAILDYALYYASDPAPYARLGYAAYLASWALVNAGPAATNYGYWFPGPENDGAAGWAFEPGHYGTPWHGLAQGRGVWSYDGEIDNGLIGALHTAAVVVVADPIFGVVAYGGELTGDETSLYLVPKDGLRQRLHLLDTTPHLHLSLNRDGFAATSPIHLQRAPFRLQFDIENRAPTQAHTTLLHIAGLPPGDYQVFIDGKPYAIQQPPSFALPVGTKSIYTIVVEWRGAV